MPELAVKLICFQRLLCLVQFAVELPQHMRCTQCAWISYTAVHLYLNPEYTSALYNCTLASANLASVLSTNHLPDPGLQHIDKALLPCCVKMKSAWSKISDGVHEGVHRQGSEDPQLGLKLS